MKKIIVSVVVSLCLIIIMISGLVALQLSQLETTPIMQETVEDQQLEVAVSAPENKMTPLVKQSQDTIIQTQKQAEEEVKIEEKKQVKISAVGDCTLGFYKGQSEWNRFDQVAEQYGPNYFMKNVKSIFEQDDLTIINLEGPLTTAPYGAEKEFVMRGSPEYIQIMTQSSIEAANLANNHTYDCGTQGYQDTRKLLESHNIGAFGGNQIHYQEINGVKVALIGYKAWDASANTKKALSSLINEAKNQAQLIIIMFHWGQENTYEPNAIQRELGRFVIDCGAHLVLGSHPHVIQGIEKYKDKNIVYSMGNFSFGGNRNPKDKDTFIYQETFELRGNEVVSIESNIIPCSISSTNEKNNYQPTVAVDEKIILDRLKKYSNDFEISYFK